MEILLDNQQTQSLDLAVWEERIARLMKAAAVEERAELSVSFVDDAAIHALNHTHRGIDRPTDVLSFPQFDPDEPLPPPPVPYSLGDIVVSIETTRRQAEEYGHSFERELAFLLTHGLLHLLGFDHETPEDEETMRTRQRELLSALGLEREGEAR